MGTEDRTFGTSTMELTDAISTVAQEITADEQWLQLGGIEIPTPDALRIVRRQDIADNGVLFR